MKLTEIEDRIKALIPEVEVDELPMGGSLAWFPGTDGKPLVFRVGKKGPGPGISSDMTIIAMFQNESEARIYALHLLDRPPAEGEKPKNLPPTRYTLSKVSPVLFAETMPLSTFEAEIASELDELDDATASPETFEPEEPAAPEPANGAAASGEGGGEGEEEEEEEEEEPSDEPAPPAAG